MKNGPLSSNILLSLGTLDMAIRFYKDDIIHLSAPSGPHKTSALRDPTHPTIHIQIWVFRTVKCYKTDKKNRYKIDNKTDTNITLIKYLNRHRHCHCLCYCLCICLCRCLFVAQVMFSRDPSILRGWNFLHKFVRFNNVMI